MMKRGLMALGVAAMCLQLAAAPVRAEMSDDEKAAAALAILGIAALAHNKHHYRDGYAPQTGDHTAEFERGYRDGVHGYAYNSFGSTVDYAEGYQAGDKERGNSMIKSRSPGKHEWEIEAAVGHEHMVCTMRDTGEVIEVRGGRM
jgi:hypothetical protein